MTPINICNHTYWNISGDFEEPTITDHLLHLPNSSKLMELDETQMTTGKFPEVKGTAFDFHSGLNKIGDKERLTGAIDGGGKHGVDHPYVIDNQELDNGTKMSKAAHLQCKKTNMEVYTTQPAIVVYTSNFVPNN